LPTGLLIGVGVPRGRGQVRAASARMRVSASSKSCCQGQRAGIRRVHCRAVRVSRPGIRNSRLRRVAAVRVLSWGRPIWLVHRPRLCARAAITVQALLAANWPGGLSEASDNPPYLRPVLI
jgi:hypothetical protein